MKVEQLLLKVRRDSFLGREIDRLSCLGNVWGQPGGARQWRRDASTNEEVEFKQRVQGPRRFERDSIAKGLSGSRF